MNNIGKTLVTLSYIFLWLLFLFDYIGKSPMLVASGVFVLWVIGRDKRSKVEKLDSSIQ